MSIPKSLPRGKEHREQHLKLHNALDELAADFIGGTGGMLSKTTILELMVWSQAQIELLSKEEI